MNILLTSFPGFSPQLLWLHYAGVEGRRGGEVQCRRLLSHPLSPSSFSPFLFSLFLSFSQLHYVTEELEKKRKERKVQSCCLSLLHCTCTHVPLPSSSFSPLLFLLYPPPLLFPPPLSSSSSPLITLLVTRCGMADFMRSDCSSKSSVSYCSPPLSRPPLHLPTLLFPLSSPLLSPPPPLSPSSSPLITPIMSGCGMADLM